MMDQFPPETFSETMGKKGVVREQHFLSEEHLLDLQQVLVDVSYEHIQKQHDSGVIENLWRATHIPAQIRTVLSDIGLAVQHYVRGHGQHFPVLSAWKPREIDVQKYDQTSGISSHQDQSFQGVIAVLTIQGSAQFRAGRERFGTELADWEVGPADLVVMAGADLVWNQDLRPFHEIGPALSEKDRISIGFRDSKV